MLYPEKQAIPYEMRSAVSAIFISGAVGGDSMTQYAADTWAVVYARERHTSSICGGRSGTATAMARHHHLCRTTRAGDSPDTLPWAARLPDVYRDFTIFINLNTF